MRNYIVIPAGYASVHFEQKIHEFPSRSSEGWVECVPGRRSISIVLSDLYAERIISENEKASGDMVDVLIEADDGRILQCNGIFDGRRTILVSGQLSEV